MRFAANVSTLFPGVPVLDRFAAAAQAGFEAVESWWPEDVALDDWTAALRDAGVRLALLNFSGGDMAGGDRGLLADPAREREFREHAPVALEVAASLGCRTLHALVGLRRDDEPAGDQLRRAAGTVRWVADLAVEQGATVVIEPLNRFDNGPYLIQTVDAALAFIRDVGRPNVGLQFDAYHVQRTEGRPAEFVRRAAPLIRHVQVADAPGRGRPGSGAIDFGAVFDALAAARYDGYVGLEYLGTGDLEADLAWLAPEHRCGELDPRVAARVMRAVSG